MGYDFLLTRLPNGPAQFPTELPADFYPSATTFTDLTAIRDALASSKGYKPNGPSGVEEHEYLWHTPDGGGLYVRLSGECIYVDTHAGWGYVLETYQCLKSLYADLVLIDPQKMTIHDESSYSRFVRESYEAKGTRNT